MDATSMTGDVGPSYPHDSVKRQEREGKRDRRYTAEGSIVCLVLFSIAHRMPSRPINSIVVRDENTHIWNSYITTCSVVEPQLWHGRSPNHFGPMDPGILGIAGKLLSL
jgi:hypothetical protein